MMQMWIPMAALAGICLLSGCQQREPRVEATSAATEVAAEPPSLPRVEPAYDREALLLAVMRTASDAALGRTDGERQRTLDGKRFELRLRFGCVGEQAGDSSRAWTFDEKRRKLSLRVEPEITGDTPLVRAVGEEGYEAVEGFWIRRPWMLAAECPAVVAEPGPPPTQPPERRAADAARAEASPPRQLPRIGLAQFFSETDSRTHRRGERGYTATKLLAADVLPSKVGYDLVVTGRLRRLADGSVIACVNRNAGSPPDCIVSAQFDTIAIVQPVSGEVIATWSGA